MAIDKENGLTYGELITLLKTWVKNNCNNVGSYSARVHASLKSGFSQSYTASNKTATFSINSADVIPVTTENTINSQIDSFFTERNITQRKDNYVTTTGLVNFWNNVAIFCNKRLILLASQYSPNPILMYNPGTVKAYANLDNLYDAYTTQTDDVVYARDFITMARAFDNALADFAKSKYVIYSIKVS